ncbi:Gfo/Idh/MocA family protein [Hoeflea olei]|uniref:Gfo/Idh/MocA-like oxidoreductase N-terminal domain-containing protein n=1 Tax=Hoeflea olei TaxID=1480615 RepID=A0A1C1Z089_9HYPH|nr:Gfo/Idh/MocA family oxidoreductase [Hoeflea olei]OCW59194.1 hypothetical protein AWJ14_09025 [Hoeflea olei]
MTHSNIIRWGIAGTGQIAAQFAGDIRHAPSAALAAVCSRDPARAAAFARSHGDIAPFGSLDDMIASGTIDAVYLATPNMAHHAQALACICAGMPVLIEKPMTASREEAVQIRTAALEAGVFAMEALWSRYLPAVRAARQALKNGVIGEIIALEADIAWPQPYAPDSRFYDKAQGGGALHDLGIYGISLARFLLGEATGAEGAWVRAASGVDISATLRLRFGHVEAAITCGFDRLGSNRLIVEGEKGVLVLGPPFIKAQAYGVYGSRRLADLAQPGDGAGGRKLGKLLQHLPLPGTARQDFGFPGTGLQFEIEAASQAIRQGLFEEPDNRLDDTIAALRIIEQGLALPPSPGTAP